MLSRCSATYVSSLSFHLPGVPRFMNQISTTVHMAVISFTNKQDGSISKLCFLVLILLHLHLSIELIMKYYASHLLSHSQQLAVLNRGPVMSWGNICGKPAAVQPVEAEQKARAASLWCFSLISQVLVGI